MVQPIPERSVSNPLPLWPLRPTSLPWCGCCRVYVLCSALPSKADVALLKSIPTAPDASVAPHVARWYKNIASYSPLEVYVWL